MPSLSKLNWALWLRGLLAAFIGGGASSIAVMVVDPLVFNLSTGLGKLGAVALVAGIVSLAAYLKDHPVPDWDGVDRRK